MANSGKLIKSGFEDPGPSPEYTMSWWCYGRCHRMANFWDRWTLVDPGRDSELKSSHRGGSRCNRDLPGTRNKLEEQGKISN